MLTVLECTQGAQQGQGFYKTPLGFCYLAAGRAAHREPWGRRAPPCPARLQSYEVQPAQPRLPKCAAGGVCFPPLGCGPDPGERSRESGGKSQVTAPRRIIIITVFAAGLVQSDTGVMRRAHRPAGRSHTRSPRLETDEPHVTGTPGPGAGLTHAATRRPRGQRPEPPLACLPRSRGWKPPAGRRQGTVAPKEVLRYQLQTHHTLLPQESPKNTLFTRITESLHRENAESRYWIRARAAGGRRADFRAGGRLLSARARAPSAGRPCGRRQSHKPQGTHR